MATTPTTPTMHETAEYVTSLRHLTQVLSIAWSLIVSERATRSREISRLLAAVREFQTCFPVTFQISVRDSLMSSRYLFMRIAHPSSPSLVLLNRFLQTISQVSIESLLCDDNTVPECRICLNPFTEKMAQAALINNNGENQPCSADPPAETVDSTENPVRLPCGHVFCKKCTYQWIITSCQGGNQPKCPLCNAVLEGIINPLTVGGELYVQEITLLCSKTFNLGSEEINGLVDQLTA